MVNTLPICEGLITRSRIKGGKEEKSILDFFIVCNRILPYVTKMVIDEEKEYILTNYKPAKKGEKAKDTDHYTQYMDINLKINPAKPVRKEIFNFKCKESQETFKKITSITNEFSKCFEDNTPLIDQVENWRKILLSKCKTAFKKIRITNKKREKALNPRIVALINTRNKMLNNAKCKEENCLDCARKCKSKSTPLLHEVNHRDEIKFKCEQCEKNFNSENSLEIHVMNHAEK